MPGTRKWKNRWLEKDRQTAYEDCPECGRNLPALAFPKNWKTKDTPNCAACEAVKEWAEVKRQLNERRLERLEMRRRRKLEKKSTAYWKWRRERWKYGRKKRIEERGSDHLFRR